MDDIKLKVRDILNNRYLTILKDGLVNTIDTTIDLNYTTTDISRLLNALHINSSAPIDILVENKENDIRMLINTDFNYTAITNVEYIENHSIHVDISKNKCRIFNCTNSITDKEKFLNYCLAEKILLAIKSIA